MPLAHLVLQPPVGEAHQLQHGGGEDAGQQGVQTQDGGLAGLGAVGEAATGKGALGIGRGAGARAGSLGLGHLWNFKMPICDSLNLKIQVLFMFYFTVPIVFSFT